MRLSSPFNYAFPGAGTDSRQDGEHRSCDTDTTCFMFRTQNLLIPVILNGEVIFRSGNTFVDV